LTAAAATRPLAADEVINEAAPLRHTSHAANVQWATGAEFVEVESGKRSDRPQLAAAMALAKRRKATLLVAKLDRLRRSVAFIATLMDSRGSDLAIADMPLTLHVLAAAAEHERHMIGERTRQALAAAKGRGIELGNPKQAEINRAKAAAQAQALRPHIERCIEAGRTSSTAVAADLNVRGIVAPNGGRWFPRGLSANEIACALISMMARSTMRSKQRPDTLIQDRICWIGEKLVQRTAGPYIRVKM
jgi:DNA invertase Pin-like site-specific DNA recombinase